MVIIKGKHARKDIMTDKTHKTHFGNKEVPTNEKESLVKGVFSNVASSYDVMNDVMSLGIHRLWKNEMITLLAPQENKRLLDVAGGTGDIAFRYLDKVENKGHVTICDINPNMLEQGKANAIDGSRLNAPITWCCGNAQNLPLEDATMDYYTIAFGIRNVTHIDKALKEAYRVLKPGGKFVCLEFSHVTQPVIAKLYDFFSFQMIPKMGKIVAKDEESYRYLVESIRKFPDQETFKQMIASAGFSMVDYKNMSQGIVALHYGWKV